MEPVNSKFYKNRQFKGMFFLFLAAFIWGTSFVAQSIGMDKIDAFTFTSVRTFMGGAFLIPVIIIRDIFVSRKSSDEELQIKKHNVRKTIKYGIALGFFLCIAQNFQQFAFYYSTSGKIAFITAVYMFFVPLIGLFFGKRIPLKTLACVILGFIGLFLLCINPSDILSINRGDLLSLCCAFFFAVHILAIEHFSPELDSIILSCTQFLVSGVLSTICMFIFETPSISNIRLAILPLLYSGVMSCSFAYTFQIIGQKYTEATIASLIMCTESLFSVVAGAIVLNEYMSFKEIIACAVMLAAIVISQL